MTYETDLPAATTELRIGVLMGRVDGLESRLAETDRAMNSRMDRFERAMTERFTSVEIKLDEIANSIAKNLGAVSFGSFILTKGIAVGALIVAAAAAATAWLHSIHI